jgi:hypothetical protein
MRVLTLCALALLTAASPPSPSSSRTGEIIVGSSADEPMNPLPTGPGCTSILRQVAGEDRSRDGTRLDHELPGRLILAVERRDNNGCREVVFANERRFGPKP